ncbi:Uncharacterised protein [Streptococcus constellatus]|uniref:Uncharacterized protein n=1 Tax=Streptococcus constellatus TaxID=76860 RepID=A0A564SR68_STRCV|nr:hypothetical protein [Streptococcus constellatus]VUW91150.1 Uncharacterised protein [Streptococcus gordonii]VUW97644.1 Uncharacterised protein [Streptococcus constellatus]
MDQEHLFWMTVSSYYYFYVVYSLLVDQSLFREIQDTDLHLVYKYFACPKTSVFVRGFMKSLFYFALPVYLFLNRTRYYQARGEDGKRLHKHDFLYRYSVYFTFPLIITRIMVYLAQDDTNEVVNTVSNLYYTLIYRIPYFQLLFALFIVYLYIVAAHYVDKKCFRFYFISNTLTIVASLIFIIQFLVGFYFYFLESVPDGLKIFSFYYGTVLALEKFLAWFIIYIGNHNYGNRLRQYALYQKKRLLNSRVMVPIHSFGMQIADLWLALRVRLASVLLAFSSINLSRIMVSLSRRNFLCAMWQLLSIFILYPALFFLLPIFFLYIFPTDSSDSPIGSYLLIRKTESQTIYYSTPSLKIFYKGQKLLYRQQLFLLVDSWVSKKNVHYLRYRSVETGITYSFIWQPHTNLLRLNGETSQEFIRDGTKDYIKNLAKDSITSLEGAGYEKWERPKEESEPFSWKKRTRRKLYKGLR